ncbi:MAG: flagellar basal body M-ring protein FliF [Helicobacteraceae bacterium]|nr:flagellar basal body M-ring protein FliF [Helicobacteraceae bacterium]
MHLDFKGLFAQLVVAYNRLERAQQIVIGGSIAVLVAFLIFLVVYTSTPKSKNDGYKVLFESLTPEESALVIEQLEKKKIEFRIPRDNVIEVPEAVVYKERIAIASLGIPKNRGVGFELFDKQEFGATQFDQNVKYMRALEGELSRTIEGLNPVVGCTVNIALPKESLFVSKQTEPTASVVVSLKEGRALTNKQSRGIKNIVAAAVPKLKVANVIVINADGEVLGADDEMAQLGEASSMQARYKAKAELNRERKIVKVLSPFLGGEERVVAKVSVEFDFDQTNSTSEIFDPENVVRSEQSLEEKREGVTPDKIGGVPGAVSNIGPVEGLDSGGGSDKYEKTTGTTNYEVSKKVSTTKGAFGVVKRITAAVVVDGKYKNKMDEEGNPLGMLEYFKLDETQLLALTALAEQAIGYDKARGDVVSVQNMKFEQLSKEVMKPETFFSKVFAGYTEYFEPLIPMFRYMVVFIILWIAYKSILSPFAERMLEVTAEDDSLEAPTLDLEDEQDDDIADKVNEMKRKVEEQLGIGSGGFQEENMKYDVILDKIKTMIEETPEETATLLQQLIIEEDAAGEYARSNKEI